MTPGTLTATERRRLRELLHKKRLATKEQQAALGDVMNDIRDARTDTQADDEHDPEGPTMSSEWSRITGLQGEAEGELLEIDRALNRLDDGSFGVCARCGNPIGVERLKARPTTELCISCARLAESG
ncbi:TraR/DksA family transcriptional regulator [Leifsonia sp. Root112D2]|uniref:TraR/DksA family transcriptional regulator n=1 Tax=Leifsonia sp. Root112D2 TaxID=1736426 RepID=UPI0006FC1130|nr:TraR/DksA C4-type zinc finger protein [Leifsonia sp. Root112D2]KQV07350.1 hypothetical protein ASC63_08625 [Leifsonia sp. Root112D2]